MFIQSPCSSRTAIASSKTTFAREAPVFHHPSSVILSHFIGKFAAVSMITQNSFGAEATSLPSLFS